MKNKPSKEYLHATDVLLNNVIKNKMLLVDIPGDKDREENIA